MSEELDWDPDWWKKERDASLERREAKGPSSNGVSLGDTFLIVTEGTVTEPTYFEALLEILGLSSVSVMVIPGRASDPRHVIDTARSVADAQIDLESKKRLSKQRPSSFDHVWAVIDTDVAVRQRFWNDVEQLAKSRNVKLAHSTPCFEFWLLLHVAGFTTRADLINGDAAKHAVESALGFSYSTNSEVAKSAIGTFIGRWQDAVMHAGRVRQHHLSGATTPPANPSTEMDLLVNSLLDSLRR